MGSCSSLKHFKISIEQLVIASELSGMLSIEFREKRCTLLMVGFYIEVVSYNVAFMKDI